MNDLTPIRFADAVEAPARFNVDEFQRMVDVGLFDGSKVELVEGVIVRMSPARPRHFWIQHEIFIQLHEIFGKGIDGRIAASEVTIQFADRTLRDIDVAVIDRFDHAQYAGPDIVLLAIEVSSTTQHYDLNEKRLEYAAGGIPHYWVVDVPAERVHIMSQPVDGDYVERHPAKFGEAIPVPGSDKTIVIA